MQSTSLSASPVPAQYCSVWLQLNSLKRYLRLQPIGSLQQDFALAAPPLHAAALASSLHKMQLAPPLNLVEHPPRPRPQPSAAGSPPLQTGSHPVPQGSFQRRRASTAVGFSSADGVASRRDGVCDTTEVRGEQGLGSGRQKWDDSGIHLKQNSLGSSVGSAEEEHYWKEQGRMQLAEQQQGSCRAQLAW